MISLLLIISFLLHIILLIAIYFLYQQLEQLKHSKNNQLETMLDEFLDEVKEENEQLQQQLQQVNFEQKKELINREKAPSVYENSLDKKINKVQERGNIKETVAPEPSVDQKVDKLETSLEAQVYQMAQAGMSADEIAQKLDRGKTEIELMLKLQLNE